jgi:anti-sigma regulatory factor (Ser/Thr protein kinase)
MNNAAVAADLPLEPESARRAREQLKPLRASMAESSFIDLCLLVDELVVEALHDETGPGTIHLTVQTDRDRVRVTMAQGGDAYRLPSRRPEPGDPGFGLHLVQRLSERWGMRRDRERAMVWLEVAATPEQPV